MALIARIAVLLGILGLYTQLSEAYKISNSNKNDAKFGRPVLAMANSPRCMFNGKPVEDGRSVSSPEPCLNCTCSKGILLCYLRTCTTVVATPGCQVVRKNGECCPKLECRGNTEYRTERTSEPSYKYRLRQDEGTFFGLSEMDPRTDKSNSGTTTTTRKPAPKFNYYQDSWSSSKINRPSEFSDPEDPPIEQEEDYGSDLSPDKNDSTEYCYHKGYKYTEGMAMLSTTKCEYCYCIRGQQMCVRPKCHMNIEGCVARYQSGYTCCPSHYQCEIGADGIGIDEYQLPSTKGTFTKVSSCNVEGYDFDVGVAVPSSGNCQTCYCTQMGVVCRRLECSPSVPGCTPIVPEGHCCPTEYKCDQQGVNETHIPVSFSTENYDVTVIPSETEDESSHSSTTETTDDAIYEESEDHTAHFDYEYDTDSTPDKQKITVELTDDSDIESISVIPEENIAVLVVTTEKETEADAPPETSHQTQFMAETTKINPDVGSPLYIKHKTKTSTTKVSTTVKEGTQHIQETTKPTIISLPNLKQKTKPSTSKQPTTVTHGTQYLQDTTRPSLASFSNLKHKTKTSTTNDPGTTYETRPIQDTTRPSIISLTNLKHKTKTSTTNDPGTTYETRPTQDTVRPSIISLTNLKQKTRPSTINDRTTVTHGTRYPQDTTRPSMISLTNLKQKTKPPPANYPTIITQGTQYSKETTSPSIISLTNLKQKTKTSTTKGDTTVSSASPHLLYSTQPTLISLHHLKHKTKTSTKVSPTALEGKTSESSTFFHSTVNMDTSTETVKHSTYKDPHNNDENKDNYAYDYVEIYDEVPHNTQETFAPFADYSETTYGERFTSTEKSPDVTINTRVKIKNKRPPSLSQTRDPTTSTLITSIANSKFATDGLTTQRITEIETDPGHSTHSTFSHAETDKYTDYPTRYTIYSTASEKTHRPYATESGGRLKQKVKPNTPLFLTNTQYASPTIQGISPFYSTMAEIPVRTTQKEESQTGADQTYQYVTETNVPSSHSFKPPTLVTSRYKQKPQRPTQTTLPFKSTKPLPQDLADLLWSITQNYNTQEQDTSTETYSSTTEKVSFINKTSETSDYIPDTLTSLVIAAPKLIVEDSAGNESQVNLQSDTTNTDTPTSGSLPPNNGSSLPGLIFKVPEIIFSNHGPSSHRKQPTSSGDPDGPIEINNHKKTTRPRPPVRFRPPPTPSVPQTSFIEISNHRPINPIRRPPGKFPPYPANNQRHDAAYRRQQNTRDPHHSLHRIAPDIHPEWREDYDEYYYDFELGRNPTTKIFTNMQDQPTETEEDSLKTTQHETQSPSTSLQPSTRKSDLDTSPITENNPEAQDEAKSTTLEFKETSKTTNEEDITGRSSADITDINDPTLYITLSTTPPPTTKDDLSTSTKYFLKDTVPDDDGKLFRAEDNNKDSKNGFIDQRHGQYEGNPNKFEVIDGRPSAERPVLKPLSSIPVTSPNEPNDPTKSEEDSKEINDVCFVDGRYYNSGEIIVKSNPCEMCRCFYGHPLCQVQQCPAPPEPSCVLEYLPGYCCPRVTCGVKVDSSQSSSEVSAPDPTNQESRPPLITSDNQWKPLPHGPIVRPVDVLPKIETPIPEVVTVPPQHVLNENTASEDIREPELNTENSRITDGRQDLEESFSASTTPTTTIFTTVSPQTTTNNVRNGSTTTQRVEITTYFPEITTEPPTEPKPVFEPAPENKDSEENKSDIHDNSSGVRKILDETVTLPLSKMSLSPSSGENISTVLPVIQTLPPTPFVTEGPLLELDTVADFLIGDLPAELGGNLKVSGCNVYGKYYRINDKVTALSKPCSECICSPDGIACNATC